MYEGYRKMSDLFIALERVNIIQKEMNFLSPGPLLIASGVRGLGPLSFKSVPLAPRGILFI